MSKQHPKETVCAHILISGFMQHAGQDTGMSTLLSKFRNDCHYCNGSSIVELHRWCSNWAWIAQDLFRFSNYGKKKLIVAIYAYSFGAGWGAMQLAKQLNKLGVEIQVMVLSDPVYRHPWTILRWMSLLKRKPFFLGPRVISIPPNIKEVYRFHQERDLPQGSHLIAQNENTLIHRSEKLMYVHTKMDEAEDFHEKALEQASKLREIHASNIIKICSPGCSTYQEKLAQPAM
jgi:hypothetical protein